MKNIQNIKGHLSIARKTAKRNADNALKLAAKRGIKLINEDTSVDAVWLRNMAKESNKLQDAREEACRNADNALKLAAKYGIKLK